MRRSAFSICVLMFWSSWPGRANIIADLKPETLTEFQKYQARVDAEIDSQIKGAKPFQWVEQHGDVVQKAKAGEVVTYAFTGSNGLSIPEGLIHDWVGVIYLGGLKIDAVRQFLLDNDRQSRYYTEVKSAKTLSQNGNHSMTRLRVVKKKVLTIELDIEYDNHWESPALDKWAFAARSRKVVEVDDGTALPPDTGHGFLWRMNSHWLLKQDAGGVWAELRVVSLSRDTPHGLGWMIKPMIRDFPAEGIASTLRQTQLALKKS
jgi:hypothetical protein